MRKARYATIEERDKRYHQLLSLTLERKLSRQEEYQFRHLHIARQGGRAQMKRDEERAAEMRPFALWVTVFGVSKLIREARG